MSGGSARSEPGDAEISVSARSCLTRIAHLRLIPIGYEQDRDDGEPDQEEEAHDRRRGLPEQDAAEVAECVDPSPVGPWVIHASPRLCVVRANATQSMSSNGFK